MSNPSKDKGTRAETAVMRACRDAGFPLAERHPLKGARDEGDIWLCPGLIVEVKAQKKRPGPVQIENWLDETFTETQNAKADFGFLVYHQPGIGLSNADQWPAYFRWHWLVRFITKPPENAWIGAITSMSLGSLLRVLRDLGWGDPLWTKYEP